MKKRRIAQLVFLVGALCLMIPPWGAVLRFAEPQGAPIRRTFSYFSPVPFGYANFGPLLCAVLLCVLLVFALTGLLTKKQRGAKAIPWLCGADFLLSLAPLCYGLAYISVPGVVISLLLAAAFVCSFSGKREKSGCAAPEQPV